jgi:hypothetical protein
MPTVFSDLLAPRESVRWRGIRQEVQLQFFIYADQSANKKRKDNPPGNGVWRFAPMGFPDGLIDCLGKMSVLC